MKKYFFYCFLLLLSVLLFSACSSSGGGSDAAKHTDEIVGKWALINNEEYKDILEGRISEDIFFSVYYIFNEDGTGSTHINNNDDIFTFEYTYDGSTLQMMYESAPSESIPCTIKGKEMHVSNNGEEVIFYKQP